MAKCFKAQILYKKMECIGLLEEKVTRVFVFFSSGWSFARWHVARMTVELVEEMEGIQTEETSRIRGP